MSGFTSALMLSFFIISYMFLLSNAANNTTQFDNFTIEWEDFSLFTCAIPAKLNVSLFTCVSSKIYSINDIDCLEEIIFDFNETSCQNATTTYMYTSSTIITTQQTTTVAATTAYIQTSTTTTIPSTTGTPSTTITINNGTSPTIGAAYTVVTTTIASTTISTTTSSTSVTSAVITSTSITIQSSSQTVGTGSNGIAAITSSASTTAVVSSSSTTTVASRQNIYECLDEYYIGIDCNISSDACAMSQPCRNLATCYSNNTYPYGYHCDCLTDYSGHNCEIDGRACAEGTCWHNGTCVPGNSTISSTNGSNYRCECVEGYNGVHCEFKISLCDNITCQNRGVCQTYELKWKCLCLDSSLYYGDYCQFKTSKLRIREILSKSFASVAIGAIVTTCTLVVIMDILKYAFHIDPVEYERESYRKRREDRKRARQPIKNDQVKLALRFQYVS